MDVLIKCIYSFEFIFLHFNLDDDFNLHILNLRMAGFEKYIFKVILSTFKWHWEMLEKSQNVDIFEI